jgi:hypothetical protein
LDLLHVANDNSFDKEDSESMPASLQDRHIHSVAMESFNNHEMDFMPLLPTKTSLSKQSSNAARQQSPFVSYPLFQSRYAFNNKDDDKENQGLGFRVNVEVHSKEIFDAGEDMGHMAVDGPVHIKQEYVYIFSASPFSTLVDCGI